MTKAAQHTSGPWHVDVEDVHVFAGRVLIAGCGGHSDNFTPDLRETQKANARLIAAAPDLLRERDELLAAIQPILAEYAKRDPIGDSDLDDEQPVHITVTLGDLRRLARIRT